MVIIGKGRKGATEVVKHQVLGQNTVSVSDTHLDNPMPGEIPKDVEKEETSLCL